MAKTPKEYAREYYYAHREQILEKQKAYQKAKRIAAKRGRPGRKPKKQILAPIVTETTAFDLRFATMVQNISEMYNSLLKSHTDLQEAYTNMKAMLKQKDEHYQAIIDKLNKRIEEQEKWKIKIRKFFNLQ